MNLPRIQPDAEYDCGKCPACGEKERTKGKALPEEVVWKCRECGARWLEPWRHVVSERSMAAKIADATKAAVTMWDCIIKVAEVKDGRGSVSWNGRKLSPGDTITWFGLTVTIPKADES